MAMSNLGERSTEEVYRTKTFIGRKEWKQGNYIKQKSGLLITVSLFSFRR